MLPNYAHAYSIDFSDINIFTIKKLCRVLTQWALIASLGACAQFPEHGQGGQAEMHANTLLSTEQDSAISAAQGLRFDYTLLKNQLDLLILNGAQYCFPAATMDGQHKEYRIAREITGALYGDASASIVIQRLHLDELERKLNLVLTEKTCTPPQTTNRFSYNHIDAQKHLLTLLNSDNQFAVNSAMLNPKYQNNLKLAAALLQNHSQHQIWLVGHTDNAGNEVTNIALALARANAVKKYLVASGLEETRISVFGAGEYAPLFDGDGDEVALVNRGVIAKLSGLQSTAAYTQDNRNLHQAPHLR